MLNKINMSPPYDATYQAVKVIETGYDPALLQTRDTIVVGTGMYHTLLVEVLYGANWGLVGQWIRKFFIRYAYYVVQPDIKYTNGLIILKQILPEEYEDIGNTKSKQIISVYDVRGVPITTPSSGIP